MPPASAVALASCLRLCSRRREGLQWVVLAAAVAFHAPLHPPPPPPPPPPMSRSAAPSAARTARPCTSWRVAGTSTWMLVSRRLAVLWCTDVWGAFVWVHATVHAGRSLEPVFVASKLDKHSAACAAVKCDENGDALEGAEPLRLWTVSEACQPVRAAGLPVCGSLRLSSSAMGSVTRVQALQACSAPLPGGHALQAAAASDTRAVWLLNDATACLPASAALAVPGEAGGRPLLLHPLCPRAQLVCRWYQPAALRLAAPPRPRPAGAGQLLGWVTQLSLLVRPHCPADGRRRP